MKKYALKRICYALLTLFCIITITFFLIRAVPGDPLATMAQTLPDQIKANFYAKYGLDQPLFTQYVKYMQNLLHGDLGESLVFAGRSVSETIVTTSPVSGFIGGIALVIGVTIGITLGIIAALNKNKWPDYVVNVVAILGVTIPVFVFSSLIQYLFAVKLGWLPAQGYGDNWKQLVLPVMCLAFGPIASYSRYMKASMLDVLDQDYILTARAKGLSEGKILSRHVFRNSMLQIVTMLAGGIVGIFTGAFITEKMFSIPGIGFYYVSSINNKDYTMILGTTIFYAVLFVFVSVILDFVYVLIDPRIRITED